MTNATAFQGPNSIADELIGFQEFVLRIVRDDAAAVYVNGIEVFRDSILNPGAGPTTFARAVGIENAQATILVDSELLLVGRNVVAVEIHQESPTSSDLSFDLRLTATGTPIPEPHAVTLPAFGFALLALMRRRGLFVRRQIVVE